MGRFPVPACLVVCLLGACLGADADIGAAAFGSATEVRRFSFEADDGQDYDTQPDDWSRRIGKGFPHYVACSIDRTTGARGNQSLRFDLNGAQAAMYSPPIPIDSRHSYVLQGRLKSRHLNFSAALLSVSILDHKRTRLRRYLSRPLTGNHTEWVDIRIGPIHPDGDARFLVIGCHIVDADRSDIQGQAWFDDIWIGSLPQMRLSIEPDRRLARPNDPVVIQTEVVGLEQPGDHAVLTEISDAEDRVLHHETFPLVPGRPNPIRWTPPTLPLGYYRVRSSLLWNGERLLTRDSSLAVIEDLPSNPGSEFGWSLGTGLRGLSPELVAILAREAGVRRLKLPLWTAAREESAGQVGPESLLVGFLERERIAVVGLINDPPPSLQAKFAGNVPGVGKIFTLPRDVWAPELEPLVVRYAYRVKRWQIGDDHDTAVEALPNLIDIVRVVRNEFDRIGRDTRIGLPWSSPTSNPTIPYDDRVFLCRPWINDSVPLAPQVAAILPSGTLDNWVHIRGESAAKRSVDQRATHLAMRLISAKLSGAQGIIFQNPLDDDRGLFRSDGAPSDLYVPWRQLATLLGGATYLGEITLPQRSRNLAFDRNGEVFLILWSDTPLEEELSFGYDARAVDLWGRELPTVRDPKSGLLRVQTGPVPIIVRDCSAGIARWFLSVQFQKGRLASEYGQHDEAVLGQNTFPQGVSGKATLHMPREWKVEPGQWTFQAAAGEAFRLPTLLTFPSDAALGTFHSRIDFEISADRPYQFTVHLPYRLGLEDLDVSITSRKMLDGRLEVEQRIVNRTDPPQMFDFDCQLFVPGQVRQRQPVSRLGQGEDKRFYYLPSADELVGKELWLRCEQVDGRRVLNQRHIVVPTTPGSARRGL